MAPRVKVRVIVVDNPRPQITLRPNQPSYGVPVPASTTLSRRELYDLVWSQPVTKVAASLGLSGRGLAKICIRQQIPTPPRGYWAQVAAGQNPARPPFLDLGDQASEHLTVFDTLSVLPAGAADVVREARRDKYQRPAKLLGIGKLDRDQVAVASFLAATVEALRSSKPGDAGEVQTNDSGECAVKVHHAQIERALSLLSNLSNSLVDEGLYVFPMREAIQIASGPDKLRLTLTERMLPLSGYTGQFVVAIVSRGGTGLRRRWADSKTQTVETLLPNIVAGLQAFLKAEKAKREDHQQRQRRWQHMEHRRFLAQQRKDREERRIGHLRRIVEMQREADDIGNWLSTLPPDQTAAGCTELGRMIGWAKSRQSLLARLTTLEAASSTVAGRNLFPDIDDLQDPEEDLDQIEFAANT